MEAKSGASINKPLMGLILASLFLMIAPFYWLDDYCSSVLDNANNPRAEQRSERSEYTQKESSNQIVQRSLFLSASLSQTDTKQGDAPNHTNQARKEPSDWRHKFWCDVKITDVALAVFTLLLVVFTAMLHNATSGLVDAASTQSTEMQNSLKIAQDSATATNAIVQTMETNARRQLRAYLSVYGAVCVPQDKTTGWRCEVRMIIRNNGFTPAHAVNYEMRTKIIADEMTDKVDLSLDVSHDEGRGHISYGQENIIRACLDDMITDEEDREILFGTNLKLCVYGTIWYKDIFGEPHWTNFFQFGLFDIKGNFSTINFPRHNDAT